MRKIIFGLMLFAGSLLLVVCPLAGAASGTYLFNDSSDQTIGDCVAKGETAVRLVLEGNGGKLFQTGMISTVEFRRDGEMKSNIAQLELLNRLDASVQSSSSEVDRKEKDRMWWCSLIERDEANGNPRRNVSMTLRHRGELI